MTSIQFLLIPLEGPQIEIAIAKSLTISLSYYLFLFEIIFSKTKNEANSLFPCNLVVHCTQKLCVRQFWAVLAVCGVDDHTQQCRCAMWILCNDSLLCVSSMAYNIVVPSMKYFSKFLLFVDLTQTFSLSLAFLQAAIDFPNNPWLEIDDTGRNLCLRRPFIARMNINLNTIPFSISCGLYQHFYVRFRVALHSKLSVSLLKFAALLILFQRWQCIRTLQHDNHVLFLGIRNVSAAVAFV